MVLKSEARGRTEAAGGGAECWLELPGSRTVCWYDAAMVCVCVCAPVLHYENGISVTLS